MRNYKEVVATINMLKFELQHFQGVTDEEAIEALTFKNENVERIQTSGTSEKTARVGLIYKEYAKRINSESKTEVINTIVPLESEIKMLETAVEGLSYQECNVIKELYFTNKSLSQVAGELAMSERSVRYIRDAAIKRLNAIYGRFNKISLGGTTDEKKTKQ